MGKRASEWRGERERERESARERAQEIERSSCTRAY